MRSRTTTTARLLRRGAAAILVAAAVLVLSVAAVGAAGKGTQGNGAGATAGPDASATDTVHIIVQTIPPRKALVKWGRKSLGFIPAPRPLVIQRPRDSGPMDLVIRATGYLPVHTRAYTFNDSRVQVKLTLPTEKNKLFGYKQEVPATPDAGVPALPVGTALQGPLPPTQGSVPAPQGPLAPPVQGPLPPPGP